LLRVSPRVYDIAVVGAGPVGLYAAAYAGDQGAKCIILDSRLRVGGLVSSFYPDKIILDFPGIPGTKGHDVMGQLAAQCVAHKHAFRLGEYVEGLSVIGGKRVAVKTDRGTYLAAAVIVAAGARAWRPRLMNHVRVVKWQGQGIYDAWPSPDELAGKAVTVITDTSTHLSIPAGVAKGVAGLCVVFSDDSGPYQLPPNAESYGRPWRLHEITGLKRPDKVILHNGQSGLSKTVATDALVDFWGSSSCSHLFSTWGLQTVKHCIRVNDRMQTSLSRVFAAGDAVWYSGKVPGIASGVAEAKRTVRNALRLG
jgi:thioredoxin reductase